MPPAHCFSSRSHGVLNNAHDTPMIGECGGNNYGNMYSAFGNNGLVYGPGTWFRNSYRSVWIASIGGWSGGDKCPIVAPPYP
jgi:hypothetical protein